MNGVGKQISMPGYSHTRKAMPSSVGLWANAFQAAFTDDLDLLQAALKLIDQNPLGTGAGYGILHVLELLRGKYHEIFAYEIQMKNTTVNLISGYHRDIQLTKEAVIRGFTTVLDSIHVTGLIFRNLKVIEENCEVAMTEELYAAEKAYKLVQQGVPFRDAYRQIGKKYKSSKVLYYE